MLVMSWGKSAHMFWIKDGDKQDWKKLPDCYMGCKNMCDSKCIDYENLIGLIDENEI